MCSSSEKRCFSGNTLIAQQVVFAASMEDSKSPAAVVVATSSNTASLVDWWHLLYAKLKSKSSLLVLIGFVALMALSYAALVSAPSIIAPFLSPQIGSFFGIPDQDDEQANPIQFERRLTKVFERAAMPNKTVIITTLNAAWAKEGAMIDMFLESFLHGDDTHKLLQHLVIVCVDDQAYQRCLVIHPHCFYIKTYGINFSGEERLLSADYIKLMWRRIEFLSTVLKINYSFVFTDTDVLWFRNPFPRLQSDTEADFQIACDSYNGDPWDVHNSPNAGFIYVRANARTVRFYDYWYKERNRGSRMADQEVFNAIKFGKNFTSIGMKLRFLDTQFFGGFCALGTTDMTKAITMHATCCEGLHPKLIDLRMMLDGWKKWHAQSSTMTTNTTQNRDNVAASAHNESTGQLTRLPSDDVQKAELNPHFKVPLACWKRH